MSVLLVDSVGMVVSTLTNILQPLGFYRIHTAKSAEEGLHILGDAKNKIDIIISMWKLKAMSGPQLAESLRVRAIPVILIVDRIDKVIDEKARQVGVTSLLQQPLDIKSVTKAVEDALAPFINEDEEAFLGYLQDARQAARKENHDKAIELFQAALAIKHDDGALFALAESMRLSGRHALPAEKTYMMVLRNQPTNLRGYLGLANLYYANKRPEDALKVLKLAMAMAEKEKAGNEARSDILVQMGEAELMLERVQNAVDCFDQAVEADPQNTQICVRAADALVSIGELEKSERYYNKALEQDPNLAHVYNRLGIAYRRQKKFDQALDLYRKALEHSPKDENLLYNMARSLWEMDDFPGAEDILCRALKINPGFTEATQLLQAVKKGIKANQ